MLKPFTTWNGIVMYEMLDEEYSIGPVVASGITDNKFFGFEVNRVITKSNKVYYYLTIDGDDEGFFTSIKDARKYATTLFHG